MSSEKRQGDIVAVSGKVKWDGEPKTQNNSMHKVRDRKLVNSSRAIDTLVREENLLLLNEEDFKITNCNVKNFYGLNPSTTPEIVA